MGTENRKYSAMGCGCYYDTTTKGEWVYCERHASWLPANTKLRKSGERRTISWRGRHLSPDPTIRSYSLYALELMGGKYYIGLTAYKNVSQRIKQHGGLFGARWTAKHRPLRVIEVRRLGKMPKLVAENLENDMAHEYIAKYGLKNVRGGRMISTRRLFLRTYNPGTWEASIQTVLLTTGIVIVVVLSLWVIVTQ